MAYCTIHKITWREPADEQGQHGCPKCAALLGGLAPDAPITWQDKLMAEHIERSESREGLLRRLRGLVDTFDEAGFYRAIAVELVSYINDPVIAEVFSELDKRA